MKNIILIIGFIICVNTICISGEYTNRDSVYTTIKRYDYSNIDKHVNKTTFKKTIKEQTLSVIETSKTEHEKVRAIYMWIFNNISYGKNHSSEDTFNEKIGVCEGISNLFYQMCKEAGVKCHILQGYTKPRINVLHAWNVVEINNNQYVIDVTWAITLSQADLYFLPDPIIIIKDHFPFKPEYQFVNNPLPDITHFKHLRNDLKIRIPNKRPPLDIVDLKIKPLYTEIKKASI